jgi:hypothetical protein
MYQTNRGTLRNNTNNQTETNVKRKSTNKAPNETAADQWEKKPRKKITKQVQTTHHPPLRRFSLATTEDIRRKVLPQAADGAKG